MNSNLPPTLARAMVSMAPPDSEVHRIIEADLSEEERQAIDAAMYRDKLVDGWFRRQCEAAMKLQLNQNLRDLP